MKKLILGLVVIGSMSAFGAKYTGIDANGDSCAIEVSDSSKYKGFTFVKVSTPQVVSAGYVPSAQGDITLENQSTQGTANITLRTTDVIKVKMDADQPLSATVARKRAVKENNWYSFYKETTQYGGTQKVLCDIY